MTLEEIREKYRAIREDRKDLHWSKRLQLANSELGQDLMLTTTERDLATWQRDEAEALLLAIWEHNCSRGSVPLPPDLFNRVADLAKKIRERPERADKSGGVVRIAPHEPRGAF